MAIRRRAKRQQARSQQHKHRVNKAIWAREVRVVGSDGEDHGVLSIEEALELAKKEKLDLVEVAPNARPPVTKIMNYGKYKFELEKRERETRKKQKATSLKEVKLRPKIGDHDKEFKVGKGIEFLQQGHKLKVTIMFSGREMAHTEIGRELLDRVKEDLLPYGKIESQPRLEGRNLSMTIAPLPEAKKAAIEKSIEKLSKYDSPREDEPKDEESSTDDAGVPETAEAVEAEGKTEEGAEGDDTETEGEPEDGEKE